jgi:D-alanyl-D-alanine-carboxypeptidase/D-alanyl-D-alanine-endopeptidase
VALPIAVWACIAAVLAGVLSALGVPGAGPAEQILLGLAAAVVIIAAGVRAVQLLHRRLRPPAVRGTDEALCAVATQILQPLVISTSVYGAVVGILSRGPASPTATAALGAPARLGAGTLVEVGSVTKALTGILLAALCQDGAVTLDQDAGQLLGLRQLSGVTLADLATHRSGLPRLPRPVMWRAVLQHPSPYARFSAERLLTAVPEPRSPKPTYSNLGFALLGLALARAADCGYPELLTERVLTVLGMHDSGFPAGPQVSGHDRVGLPLRAWHMAAFAPAGGLCSTVADLLLLAGAVLQAPEGPLGPAVALATQAHAPYPGGGSIGLGWMISGSRRWHNGGTNGMYAWIGVDRQTGCGAALAVTSQARRRFDTIGGQFLRASHDILR